MTPDPTFTQARAPLKPGSAKRRRIYKRDGMTCQYCGTTCVAAGNGGRADGDTASLDHRIPRSRGGTNDDGNLSLACAACNKAKGYLTAEEFMLVRSDRYRRSPAVIAAALGFARADREACDIERKARLTLDAFRETDRKYADRAIARCAPSPLGLRPEPCGLGHSASVNYRGGDA